MFGQVKKKWGQVRLNETFWKEKSHCKSPQMQQTKGKVGR